MHSTNDRHQLCSDSVSASSHIEREAPVSQWESSFSQAWDASPSLAPVELPFYWYNCVSGRPALHCCLGMNNFDSTCRRIIASCVLVAAFIHAGCFHPCLSHLARLVLSKEVGAVTRSPTERRAHPGSIHPRPLPSSRASTSTCSEDGPKAV